MSWPASRSSSAAPWIAVSGDFSSCETWVAKVLSVSDRACSFRAMSRKAADSSAISRVPWLLERAHRAAVAGGDAWRAPDQLVHRPADGAHRDIGDEQRRAEDRRRRKHDLAALAIEVLHDVVRGPRQIDRTGDAAIDDDRHRHEDAHARAAADRIERRRQGATRRGRAARWHSGRQGRREPLRHAANELPISLPPPAITTPVGSSSRKPGERGLLRVGDHIGEPRADRCEDRIGRRRQRIGARHRASDRRRDRGSARSAGSGRRHRRRCWRCGRYAATAAPSLSGGSPAAPTSRA